MELFLRESHHFPVHVFEAPVNLPSNDTSRKLSLVLDSSAAFVWLTNLGSTTTRSTSGQLARISRGLAAVAFLYDRHNTSQCPKGT